MNNSWKITYFKPDKEGISRNEHGYRFCAAVTDCAVESGLILYDSKGDELRFPFSSEYKQGNLYGIQIEAPDIEKHLYNFYQGDMIFTDPCARAVHGLEHWGQYNKGRRLTYGIIATEEFNWQDDRALIIPYSNSIIYGLNVRAFSMHKSAGVKHRGTFEGIIEKIPYFKELGITSIEMMPCYEYDECIFPDEIKTAKDTMNAIHLDFRQEQDTVRLNCWGFQKGFYFAPKSAYCTMKNPVISFKTMVKKLHANGIEIIMQFYFEHETHQLFILEVLKHWVKEYHVDGFRINGAKIPYQLLTEDYFLRNTKIWFSHISADHMVTDSCNKHKHIAIDQPGFKDQMRRFIKGDEGLLNTVLHYQRHNPIDYCMVNYLSDYDGFSLYDYVSYERKHNETNGEDNQDGTDMNYSWNCGVEGETRKKAIQDLRLKQLKNALALIFLSQGTPFLFSGDEFANTRFGNNNAYCQDNDTGWIKWHQSPLSDELFVYVKNLISLRKKYQILHMPTELRIMDTRRCGYPDISYHGVEAWRPDLSYNSHLVGILLCGQYADTQEPCFYIAINMHWVTHQLALPSLPSENVWIKIADTNNTIKEIQMSIQNKGLLDVIEYLITVNPRSIAIYQSVEKPKED